MSEVVIIPARYNSTRFPGKVLCDIAGDTLLHRVWLKCIQAVSPELVFVATDNMKVVSHCIEKGMQYIMTSEKCLTGTDRVAEAYGILGEEYDTIINVQGDEPLVEPQDILKVLKAHKQCTKNVCCGTTPIKSEEEFRNPNVIKIIMNISNNELLYASREAIPTNKKLGFEWAYKQVCIYAFSPESLNDFSSLIKTPLETIEDIEFLRFLEIGYKVKMVEVSDSSIAVDVPDDVKKVEEALKRG
jgi:3-deoxy-manno-octulosonate cytidylyltransferase (CMP-KDO synthetase)